MLVTRRFTALNGTAILVGAMAGLAAVGLRVLIDVIQGVAFSGDPTAGGEGHFLPTQWGVFVILVPLAGGLLVGLIRVLFPTARRQGIAEVMAAVQVRDGMIRGRSFWGHGVISAITVGTGGSTGREGPIAYIGGALGSSLGRRLGLRVRDIKVLVGCGTSAGIAATFNAPLGGVLFAMELILPEFSTHAFIPVVIATVVGVTVRHFYLGDEPTFLLGEGFVLESAVELPVYLLLGLICGLGGVGFIKLMGWANRTGDRMRVPTWTKPALGGLVVGILGYGTLLVTGQAFLGGEGHYHIFGTGYATVNGILQGFDFLGDQVQTGSLVALLLLLIVAKPLASSITIGSGGGGGVFSASLYQGALYGALVGIAAQSLLPAGQVAPIAAYALVGMGAFYASAGRATLTTIVLLSELTNGYEIILPIMFAAVTADAVSVGLSKESIYTVRLAERGILYEHDRVQSPLDFVQVKEVMVQDVHTLPAGIQVGEAFSRMLDIGHTGYPVMDEEDRLMGVVTRRDLSKHMHEGRGEERLGDVVSGLLITAFPEERLHRARDRLFEQDIGRLVIVDPVDRRRLLGIVTRSDLLRAEAERDVEHVDAWNP